MILKKFAFLLISVFSFSAYSQERFDIKLKNDTVYNYQKALFLCRNIPGLNGTNYVLISFDKKIQSEINLTEKNDVLSCHAVFPVVKLHYYTFYPKMEITQLLESYIRNKVISNGKIDTTGLKSYCDERKIPLTTYKLIKVERPGEKKKKETTQRIVFRVQNMSYGDVKVLIEAEEINKIILIKKDKSGLVTSDHDGKICLLDANEKPLECRQFQKTTGDFSINITGTGFK
jgi:hypothetical protein